MELKRFEKVLRSSLRCPGLVNRSPIQPILKVNKHGPIHRPSAFTSLVDRKEVDARDGAPRALVHGALTSAGMTAVTESTCVGEPLYAATRASTRNGLPDPFSIFSGVVISTAPVGGS